MDEEDTIYKLWARMILCTTFIAYNLRWSLQVRHGMISGGFMDCKVRSTSLAGVLWMCYFILSRPLFPDWVRTCGSFAVAFFCGLRNIYGFRQICVLMMLWRNGE